MKSAMYQVIQTKSVQTIKISVSDPRTGYALAPVPNSKLLYASEVSVEQAKDEFRRLAAEGYTMTKGQNILR